MFRTADAAGVERIILSGYTPTPKDRFNQPRKDFAKVSLGAEHSVPWVYVKTLNTTLSRLKKMGYTLAALEQAKNSVNIFDAHLGTKPLALIVGNEVRGVSPALLKKADVILEIPMRGKKESLNVSVATGIALFVLTERK